jgi:hypothetical protein
MSKVMGEGREAKSHAPDVGEVHLHVLDILEERLHELWSNNSTPAHQYTTRT